MLHHVRRNVHVIVVCEELEQAGTIVRVVVRTLFELQSVDVAPKPARRAGPSGLREYLFLS